MFSSMDEVKHINGVNTPHNGQWSSTDNEQCEAVSDRDSRSTDDDRHEEVDLSLENTQADGIFLQDEELDVNLNHQENMDEELLLDQVINSNAIPELNGNSTPELKAEKHKIQQNGKSGKSAKKSSRSRRTTESDKMSTISEESERTEMTVEEKEDMYKSVIAGDIDLLDDLMDLPGANINMTWFNENLLMSAIRHQQQAMSEFLIDNHINYNYTTTIMDKRKLRTDVYTLSCRQLAYDLDMSDIVELIDELNGNYWRHRKPKERVKRMKKTWMEKHPPTPESDGCEEEMDGEWNMDDDLNCDVPLDSLGCTVRNSTPDHDVDVKAESPSNPDPTNTDVITKINSQSNARRESENESILSYNVPCLKSKSSIGFGSQTSLFRAGSTAGGGSLTLSRANSIDIDTLASKPIYQEGGFISRFPPPKEHHYKANRTSLSRQTQNEMKIDGYSPEYNPSEHRTRWQGGAGVGGAVKSPVRYTTEDSSAKSPPLYITETRCESSTRASPSDISEGHASAGFYRKPRFYASRSSTMMELQTKPKIKNNDKYLLRRTWDEGYGAKLLSKLEDGNSGRSSNKGRRVLQPLLRGKHELINTSKGPMMTMNWTKNQKSVNNVIPSIKREQKSQKTAVPKFKLNNNSQIKESDLNNHAKMTSTNNSRMSTFTKSNSDNTERKSQDMQMSNGLQNPQIVIDGIEVGRPKQDGNNRITIGKSKKLHTPAGYLHTIPSQMK